jgi:hypothetical protein
MPRDRLSPWATVPQPSGRSIRARLFSFIRVGLTTLLCGSLVLGDVGGVDAVETSAQTRVEKKDGKKTQTKKTQSTREKTVDKKGEKKKAAKPRAKEKSEPRAIDVSNVWRESEVFSADQLVKLEPILRTSTCKNETVGCPYHDNGRPGSEGNFDFRLIPWKVSRHRSYLVRNDRCAPGGCDQGLFVQIDGRWRLVTEMFGVLERQGSSTRGFEDLVAHPRGQPSVNLVWDGQAYREADR